MASVTTPVTSDHSAALIVCPVCSRPAMILMTVSGRGGHSQMCFACWRKPKDAPASHRQPRPQAAKPAKAKQGSHL